MIHSSALPNCHSVQFCPLWHMWHFEMWFVMNYSGHRNHLGYRQNISDAAVLYLIIAIYWCYKLESSYLVRLNQGLILVILTPWVYMIGQYLWNYGKFSSQCIGTYQIRMSSQLHWRSLNCRYCNWQFWPVCTEHYVAQPYQWDVIMWYSVLVWYLCFFRQGDCLKRNSDGMMVLTLKHISHFSQNPGIHRDKLNILLQSLWWWRL